MEEKEYLPPIVVSGSGDTVRISYDQVTFDFQPGDAIPADAPPLARRIFEAFTCDLQAGLQAE